MSFTQRKMTFEPRIKLNHNIYHNITFRMGFCHFSSFGPWRKLMNGDEDWNPLIRTEVNSQKWVHGTHAANLSGADDVRRVRLVPFCVVAVRSVPESFSDDVRRVRLVPFCVVAVRTVPESFSCRNRTVTCRTHRTLSAPKRLAARVPYTHFWLFTILPH